ncbi:MAG: ATP-binding protein [Bacteroidota bacterium]|nr:ATP-binding protein [Bacteroidota bacterium]
MINRQAILKKLTILSKEFPVITLLGPRQVGKTTLVQQFTAKKRKDVVHLDMERLADRNRLADPEIFFEANRNKIVVIDEVQLMPHLFSVLRPEVDALRKNGRFILTGSASPELVKGVSESLAGRIAYIDVPPISILEATEASIVQSKHWFRGGFPLALTAKQNEGYARWAENFVRSYVERDLSVLFGTGISAQLARNFWSMVSVSNGNIWNAESMARSLGVSGPTINRYLDFMEGAFLIRRLPAWYVNAQKRLVKAPKVYVRDSGLLHYLNNVADPRSMAGHPIVGSSWEGYVIEEICKQLPYHIKPYFYRTHHGAEVDLVLVKGIAPVTCIEIKHSLNPTLTEGFYNCIEDLKTKHNFVIYPGEDTYKNAHGVEITPLINFLDKFLKQFAK